MKHLGYDEMNISQIPALEVLEKLGYQIYRKEESEFVVNAPKFTHFPI